MCDRPVAGEAKGRGGAGPHLGRLFSSVHRRPAAPARRRRTASLLVVLATAWTACEGPGNSADRAPVQPTVSVTTTTPGDDVTLSGRVTAAYGPHVFAVGSGAERAIVVTGTPVMVSVGSDVEVTGRVQVFRRGQLEAELGVDLGPAVDELENATCLVASVARLP